MRGIREWARLLGLRRAVVEGVRLGNEGSVVVRVQPGFRERDRVVCAGVGARGMTRARAVGDGGRLIWVRPSRSSRPRRRGCAVLSTAWWCARCRRPGMARGSPRV